jgi:alcohol dehydrogenase, propanol-preferring
VLAFQLTAPGTTALREVPVPEPGPGEVLIRVAAAGACHSDLHKIDNPAPKNVPITLGHEIAGRIETTGPGVTGFAGQEPVAIYGVLGCGRCAQCLLGRDNACRGGFGGIGLTRDGGMAEFVTVPSRSLMPLGDLDLVQAAPLSDAGLTSYHAIEANREGLGPGSSCVVLGVGGLGHLAIQILRATTATRIIAADVDPAALALAGRLGADVTVDTGDADAAVAEIREHVGHAPGGADVVFDFVGLSATLDIARRVVATGGHLSLVGLGGGTLSVSPGSMTLPFEVRVTTPFWGTRAEFRQVLALAARGDLTVEATVFGLADVATAYDGLRAGAFTGRGVVVPGAAAPAA